MINTDSRTAYEEHVASLRREFGGDEAMRRAIGGDFVAIGRLEYHLLRSLGLADGHLVVDVGCGSGRLACQLAAYPGIRYVGCDVVAALLDHAKRLSGRSDWLFIKTDGSKIPCENGAADFVCFFSVFTHLFHEQSYRYVQDAARVLKPRGLLVLSFLEFEVPMHWKIFIEMANETTGSNHHNQFIDRYAIRAWSEHAG